MTVPSDIGTTLIDSLLSRLYYGSKEASSFSSARRLFLRAKRENANVTQKSVDDWLKKQQTYTRHKRPRHTFPRRKVLTLRIDECWAADLIQIDSLMNQNAGFQYILTVVDLFSRKLWARKLKQKSKQEMERSMRSIVEENGGKSPYMFWTDEGLEFLSLKEFYDEMEIERYSTRSPIKSTFAERMNRTLEELLYKKMTAMNTRRWIYLLDEVVDIHNNRISSVLHGLTPNQAHQKENEEFLRAKFLADYEKHKKRFKKQKPKFMVGDTVRVIRKKMTFNRGYEPAFGQEIFTIREVKKTYPVTYKLEGKQRAYYSPELVAATRSEVQSEKQYFIERTRVINVKKLRSGGTSGGQKQYLLKARNDPEQSSWIDQFEYEKLKDGGYL